MTLLLSCEGISKHYGSHQLFNNISLSIFKGDKLGVIGPNGTGKSTLLKILAGLDSPDEGIVAPKRNLRISYVPQESNFPNFSLLKILMEALDHAHLSQQEKDTQSRIMLSKMGFQDLDLLATSLSGGWKKRLEFAKALVLSPDLVLLDEPTNHLDLEGILWLEKFLQSASFTFLIISHDRYFLENITNRMMELNGAFPSGLLCIEGSYSTFLEKREEFLLGQQQYERSLKSKVRREIEWLKQTPKARTTKAQSRINEAEKLIQELSEVKSRNLQKTTQIDFASTLRESRKLIVATNLSKTLGERLLFSGVNLTISPGTRLGIVGANGSGKSTLLRILAGQIPQDKGTVKYADGVRIVYFDQHREQLPLNLTLREALAPENETINYRGQTIHVNAWCKRFLFTPDRLDLPIKQLSGGERARILIARLMLQPADVLLLDEPTNDLDIPTLEILEDSLLEFPGAVILISHDRFMLDQISNVILGLGMGEKPQLLADYSQWEAFCDQHKELEKKRIQPEKSKTIQAKPIVPKKLSYKEMQELEGMQSKIGEMEHEIEQLQAQVHHPSISCDSAKLQETCEALHQAQSKLEELFSRWQELESKKNNLE